MRAIALFITILSAAAFGANAQTVSSTNRTAGSTNVAAVPGTVGTWYGVIDGYEIQTWQEPRRQLVIDERGCSWGELNKLQQVQCGVTSAKVTFVTPKGARIMLDLTHEGALRGSYTEGSKTFRLAMARNADGIAGWQPLISGPSVDPALAPFLDRWAGKVTMICGTQVDRKYEIVITAEPNGLYVHYKTQKNECMTGLDFRIKAEFSGKEIEFFGDTKRYTLRLVGDVLDLNVYWKTGDKKTVWGFADGARLHRQ